ncbi:YdeI/OmpD-associated family protein [Pontibacter locisalis]|uniref:YdeI/OmpD-associated family protein n=1 Tax=Pontibacter locisalis TaxID=1719035 RepID=A0ABW5IL83_9BACT
MTAIGKKLQLKNGQSLLLVNAPEWFGQSLVAEGHNVTVADEAPSMGAYDAVQLFVRSKEELVHFAPEAIALLKPGAMLWIAYPKKSSGIKSDLTRDEGWKPVAELGFAGVRQIAIDEAWSSLRFKQTSERKEASMFGIDIPGIDRKTKTVILPEDMTKALKQANLVEEFNKLAFTHRKEYVVAVLEAKRPETRSRRIQQAVDYLTGKSKK